MLDNLLKTASQSVNTKFGLSKAHRGNLSIIIENACSGNQKAALAVMITLLLKKHQEPEQNIRLHRASMDGGFSGRSMDAKEVTPFLRRESFPYMQSGSGWLTRSFEQDHPYDKNYPGKIRPVSLRSAFLDAVDEVENGVDAESSILFMLRELFDWRTEKASLTLAMPLGKQISEIVDLVNNHWESEMAGVSKLPVLATYAAYSCLIDEVAKYKGCKLDELRSHTSADEKTKRIGDVELFDPHGYSFEAVEIKYKQLITPEMIEGLKEKISGAGIKYFYILSTNEEIKDMDKITNLVLSIRKSFGCQVIVNGVASTLKYYLRLMKSTDNFVRRYVALVETDEEIPFELKRCWNQLVILEEGN